jgi:prepilin-type N-terminal cleavage/methylation domain-containing protein
MKRRAFSMVEVLTVIAIIGILAAIIFPVFFKAKVAAKRGADTSNMKSIWQALSLYHQDQGGYPPMLLQVAEYNGATLSRLNEIRRGFLFRKWVKDLNVFSSAGIRAEKLDRTTPACWPNRDPSVPASQPSQYQFGGPANTVTYAHLGINPAALNGQAVNSPAEFYAFDNYDIAPSVNPGCAPGYELRYILFWTTMGQTTRGDPNDNQRQLGYNNPSDDTIVTWNSAFQELKGTPKQPINQKGTLVLYLSGSVKPEDSKNVYEKSWRFGQ